MARPNGKPGEVIGLRVSRMDPMETYDLSAMAVQMAQHMGNADQFRKDSEVYAKQAKYEDRKARELKILINQTNDYRRNKKAAADALVNEAVQQSKK